MRQLQEVPQSQRAEAALHHSVHESRSSKKFQKQPCGLKGRTRQGPSVSTRSPGCSGASCILRRRSPRCSPQAAFGPSGLLKRGSHPKLRSDPAPRELRTGPYRKQLRGKGGRFHECPAASSGYNAAVPTRSTGDRNGRPAHSAPPCLYLYISRGAQGGGSRVAWKRTIKSSSEGPRLVRRP